jgi:PKD repeat protein
MKRQLAIGAGLLTFAFGGLAVAGVTVGGDNNGTVTLGQSLVIDVSDAVSGGVPGGLPYGLCGPNTEAVASGHAAVGPLGPAEGGSGWRPLSVSCSNGTWNYSGTITVTVPQDAGSSMWVSVAVQEFVPLQSVGCSPICTQQIDYNFNHTYPVATPPAPTNTVTTLTGGTTTGTVPGTTAPATTTIAATTTATPSATVTQTVRQPATPPVADFTAALVNPNVVTFTDASAQGTAAIASHTWQFGDGTAAAGTTPTHSYSGPGTYNVTEITVDASGLTSVAVHELTVTAGRVVLGPRQTQIISKPGVKPKANPVAKHAAKKHQKVAPKKH